jgi:hypothetical protein
MIDRRDGPFTVALGRLLSSRDGLRALAALLAGGSLTAAANDVVRAKRRHRKHGHGHGRNPRKRLRHKCHKQCNQVHKDCLHLCHLRGYPDEICHPQCATAKHGCRGGC